MHAKEQEKNGDLYTLRGEVEILYQDMVLRADQATYDDSTGLTTFTGHVSLDGGPYEEHLEATHGEYNVRTETGKFYDAVGTVGTRPMKHATLLTANPFALTGAMVEKVGAERYIVHHGSVTSCQMPTAAWTFHGERIVVDVGDTAKIYNGTFRVRKLPVFYFPFATHPVERQPRKTGFLLPTFGTSSRKGTILGEFFYWAINRSMDATLGAEYWTNVGWAQRGEFRARPSEFSHINFDYFGVTDTKNTGAQDQSGQNIRLNGDAIFAHDVRGIASLEYLSSYGFRQAYSETFSQAINSEVKSNAFLSKNYDGFSLNALSARYQNFQSTRSGDVISIYHLPSFDASTVERSIGGSRFFWAGDMAVEGLSRREPGFRTADLVGRVDLHPNLSLAYFSHGWTLRPRVALRDTYYTERRLPLLGAGIGTTGGDAVNRRALEAGFELRPPALGRIYERTVRGRRLKHTIEPKFDFRYVDGVNNFQNIIRFDARDIYTNTSEVEYGVVNRIYSKRLDPKCEVTPPASENEEDKLDPVTGLARLAQSCGDQSHELITWELGQKYFINRDFGGALVNGVRNVFTSTAEFSGIAFLTAPRRLSPILSRLRVRTGASTDVDWALDYDTTSSQINASTVLFNYRHDAVFFGAGHTYMRTLGVITTPTQPVIPTVFNQVRFLVGYGNLNKRGLSTAAATGFDIRQNFAQYIAVQSTYNWSCCGITMEFRRLALGAVRNENQFRFTFSLANVGNLGTLRRSERLY